MAETLQLSSEINDRERPRRDIETVTALGAAAEVLSRFSHTDRGIVTLDVIGQDISGLPQYDAIPQGQGRGCITVKKMHMYTDPTHN